MYNIDNVYYDIEHTDYDRYNLFNYLVFIIIFLAVFMWLDIQLNIILGLVLAALFILYVNNNYEKRKQIQNDQIESKSTVIRPSSEIIKRYP